MPNNPAATLLFPEAAPLVTLFLRSTPHFTQTIWIGSVGDPQL
jgi:hypothetical protein